jgi:hypothetical protein
MMTVRFPNGVAVKYPTATYLMRGVNSWDLYTEKDGSWVTSVQLSAGLIVEATSQVTVTAPPIATAKAALQFLVNALNAKPITGWEEESLLRELKAKLARFNARKKVWR